MEHKISASQTNGHRCIHEIHRFRIGVDDRETTEFTASLNTYYDAILNALIDHAMANKKGSGKLMQIQVLCDTRANDWSNFINPSTGSIIGAGVQITPELAKKHFEWACNAVQMGRDIVSLSSGLAKIACE
jgi:hypothetical protein